MEKIISEKQINEMSSIIHTNAEVATMLLNHKVSEEAMPYVSLWRAVVLQAFQDALCPNVKNEYRVYRIQAKAWLRGDTAYFRQVCYNAELEPSYVINHAKRLGII